jgi:hypothetical protein
MDVDVRIRSAAEKVTPCKTDAQSMSTPSGGARVGHPRTRSAEANDLVKYIDVDARFGEPDN